MLPIRQHVYNIFVIEIYFDPPDETVRERTLNLITYVESDPARVSKSDTTIPVVYIRQDFHRLDTAKQCMICRERKGICECA